MTGKMLLENYIRFVLNGPSQPTKGGDWQPPHFPSWEVYVQSSL